MTTRKAAIATKPKSKSASEVYNREADRVEKLLKDVGAAIKGHRASQAANSRSWGYVGDMKHYASELEDILASLKGEDS